MLRSPEVRENAPDPTAGHLGAGPSRLFRMRDGGVPEANTNGAAGADMSLFKSLRQREFAARALMARDLTLGS